MMLGGVIPGGMIRLAVSDSTAIVYGRLRARRTIHMLGRLRMQDAAAFDAAPAVRMQAQTLPLGRQAWFTGARCADGSSSSPGSTAPTPATCPRRGGGAPSW